MRMRSGQRIKGSIPNSAKRVFSCKDRCRYSRKRATICRNFANRRSLTSPPQKKREKKESQLPTWPRGGTRSTTSPPRPQRSSWRTRLRRRQRASVGKISANCCSFSTVSAPIFARKYAFCSIFPSLPDSQSEIFEIWQYFANFATFAKFLLNFHKKC